MTQSHHQDGDEHIWALNFPEWQEVTGRLSIADLHKPRERCGIYVLGFANGERYVGQAVDVVRRFTQHVKTHRDITHITFRTVKKADLNEVERLAIHTLEAQGLHLRNIAHMSVVEGERDLDLVVTPEEQEQWLLGNLEGLQDAQQRVQDESLRRRYAKRFGAFMRRRNAQDALSLLGLYLQAALPFPKRTELSFWAASCLPSDKGRDAPDALLCRVSLNMQEVFSLWEDENGLYATFHLARTPFEENLGENWQGELTAAGWEWNEHQYGPGGHDQFQLVGQSFEDIRDMLLSPPFADAMRLLNLRLMRRGPTYYGRYHSLDLVEAALHSVDVRLETELEKYEQWLISEGNGEQEE